MFVRLIVQPEVQPTQVPVPGPAEVPKFPVPPAPVIADLSHQQAEINRLMQVAQQWSAEGPHQYNQAPEKYNQDRFSTNAGRGRSIWAHSIPNMSPVLHNRMSRHFDELEQQRYGYHDRRFQHDHRQQRHQRRYSHASSNANNNSTSIIINSLENFTAEILVQSLAQAALGSIQEFNGNDKATTVPWLDQVELVAERTGNGPVEVGISKLRGLALGDITKIRKEEGLTWHKFRQILIENYSNIPYVSDALVAYTNLKQQDDESTSQYLIRAKVLLECIPLSYPRYQARD